MLKIISGSRCIEIKHVNIDWKRAGSSTEINLKEITKIKQSKKTNRGVVQGFWWYMNMDVWTSI